MLQIKFRGRGGQGAVVAAEILGKAFFKEGKWPQAFSLFGSERRGAPVNAFLRVDNGPIYLKCRIYHPDHVLVFDSSLVDDQEVLGELKPGGLALINTSCDISRLQRWRSLCLGLVDAGEIARSLGLGNSLNTAMLGAYVRLTRLVGLETLISAVQSMVPAKIDANIEAVRVAYERVRIYEGE